VESVAWVALRKDLLSALFSILTLCLYVYYIEKPVIKRYVAALFCFALALMSKPMAVTLPMVMILIDYWPLKRFGSQKSNPVLWQIKEKTPFFVLSAVFSVITLYAHADSAMTYFPLVSRIANAPVSFIMYPGKIFWPYDMAVLQILSDNLPLWQVLGSVLLIIFVSVAVIAVMRRFPYLFAGWLWYAITIGPVLGIIQINSQAITYHYAYLPSIGIYVMMAWGVPLLFPRKYIRRNILFPAAMVLVCLLAVLAWKQCSHWENDIAILKHALRVSKDNYTAHNAIEILAHNTVANYLVREGRIDEALGHYNEAIRISPSSAEVYANRGNVYSSMGRYQRAIEDYNETIRLKPDYADAYNNRGNTYTGMGRYEQAVEDYSKAIRLKPDFADAYSNRGNVYTRIGLSQNALQDFNESIRLNQTSASAYNNRGILYVKLGRYQQAVDDFSKAIGLQKDCFEAFYNRGRAYSQMEQYEQAIADYNKAIILKPGNAEVYKSLEFIYSKQGKDKSGCSAAQKACSSEETPGYYE
jgi:tetratricopeptide (TPR) repeat protein